jgi:phospholipid/cholesterol/gamma-HCH transport system substrate-binding protein
MRAARALVTLLALLTLAALVVVGIDRLSGGGSGGYLVRAVFDNSSFVIPGEDVKIAGVKVGTIDAVELTPANKAALVLRIETRRFVPFRTDAHCEIGLESLLGEQFVQCTESQPRHAGVPAPPPLAAIGSGPDKGQHLLPVQNTTTPVGLDQLADIARLPQQQRLQLIISGLGAGLAGNGHALNAALVRADPALAQTNRVIMVLANQNRLLARLTTDSDRILAPLARQRAHVGGVIQHLSEVAGAAAQQGQLLQQSLARLPPFLRQLRPAAQRLSLLAGQMIPALGVLHAHAPEINASVRGLGPLVRASIPAFQTLGRVAQRGERVFPRINSVARELLRLATPLQPLAAELAALSSSFDRAGGIEDVMRFIYYYTGAINGEDALSHYIRSSFEVGACSARSSRQVGGCGSTFATTTLAGAAADATGPRRLDQTSASSARALLAYLLRP